jgi:hypothetical protein
VVPNQMTRSSQISSCRLSRSPIDWSTRRGLRAGPPPSPTYQAATTATQTYRVIIFINRCLGAINRRGRAAYRDRVPPLGYRRCKHGRRWEDERRGHVSSKNGEQICAGASTAHMVEDDAKFPFSTIFPILCDFDIFCRP